LKIHNLLGLKYFSRVDFRVVNGTCYVLDVNTMPNMHPQKSLIPAMLQNDHMPLSDFIYRLIELNKQISSVNLTKLNAHVLN
jgi:D-alanine-D-alanine ligase-like ATP-grasp enzyme